MSNILSFDSAPLESLLKKWGVKKTWASLLATRISNSDTKFHYMLSVPFLAKAKLLPTDLLKGLSIGEISVLYEYCVAKADINSRKDNGQFFTPDDISTLMVEQTKEFPKGVWLDPCSGIGNLSWHLVNAHKNKEEFLIKYMILADRDALALEIARILFTLSFQKKNNSFYHEIKNSFIQFDFLSVADGGEAVLFGNEELSSIPSHDFVIVNPPYLGLNREDSRFETSKAKDLYAYFLENIIKTSKGFVSVTPQSFTNARKFESLRRLLLEKFPQIKIYAFDNIPGNIFFGVKFGSTNSNTANSIRAAITVARLGLQDRKITSLLRWKTSEREMLFSRLDEFLSAAPLTPEYFPKVSKVFQSLHRDLTKKPRLESLISTQKTEHVLFVPAAPRYFISALKSPVSRASMKTIYFRSKGDLNLAYLLINSSLMYWWWRVRDGGMTLSLETIKSMPIPEFIVSDSLVKALVKSETSNKVYKMNAGALHENVKHDKELLNRLNRHILPKYGARLLLTHDNSELVQLPKKPKKGLHSVL